MNLLIINSYQKWDRLIPTLERMITGFKNNGHKVYVITNKNTKFNDLSEFKRKRYFLTTGANLYLNTFLKAFYLIRKKNINVLLTLEKYDVIVGSLVSKFFKIANIRLADSYKSFTNNDLLYSLLIRNSVRHCIVTANYAISKAKKYPQSDTIQRFSTVYTTKDRINVSVQDIAETRTKWACDKNDIVLGINTPLNETEGITDLLYAFTELLKDYTNLKLIINGIGNKKHKLIEICTHLKILNNVVFTGFSKTPEINVPAYDICIFSSYVDYFPETIFDYLNYGKPVVSVDICGISEVLQHSYNSLLFKKNDRKTLKNHIESLLVDEEVKTYIAKNALKTSNDYSCQKMITSYENIFCRYV